MLKLKVSQAQGPRFLACQRKHAQGSLSSIFAHPFNTAGTHQTQWVEVEIDRRMVDFIVGLDSEVHQLVVPLARKLSITRFERSHHSRHCLIPCHLSVVIMMEGEKQLNRG